MTSRQPPLPLRDDESVQTILRLPLGTWFSNQRNAFRLVRRWPGTGEIELEGALSSFRTTPEKLFRFGYRPVKRKPKHAGRELESVSGPGHSHRSATGSNQVSAPRAHPQDGDA